MKTSILIIATLLVAASYQECCSACTTSFETAHAGGTSATVDNTAPPADHFCQAIWTEKGTCCDAAKSTLYWNEFSATMTEQKNRIKTKLESIDWVGVKNKAKIVKVIIEAIKVLWSTKNISNERWDQFKADLELSEHALPTSDNIGEQVDTCYASYIDFRQEAFCWRCSGAGSEFWDESINRYVLHDSSCNKIVNDCGVVFALAAYSNRTFASIKSLWEQKDSASETEADQSHNELTNDDIKAILNCAEDKAKCLTDDTLRLKLCNQFTLNGENRNLEGDVDVMTYGADKLNEFNGTNNPLATTGGTTGGNRRVLNTAGDAGYVQASQTGGITLKAGQLDENPGMAKILSSFALIALTIFTLF